MLNPFTDAGLANTPEAMALAMLQEALRYDEMFQMHGTPTTFDTTPPVTGLIMMFDPNLRPLSRDYATVFNEPVRTGDHFVMERALMTALQPAGGNSFTFGGQRYSTYRIAPVVFNSVTLFLNVYVDQNKFPLSQERIEETVIDPVTGNEY